MPMMKLAMIAFGTLVMFLISCAINVVATISGDVR